MHFWNCTFFLSLEHCALPIFCYDIKLATLSQFESPHGNSVEPAPHNAEFVYKIKSKSQWGCAFNSYCGHTKCSIDPYAFERVPFHLKILNLQKEIYWREIQIIVSYMIVWVWPLVLDTTKSCNIVIQDNWSVVSIK